MHLVLFELSFSDNSSAGPEDEAYVNATLAPFSIRTFTIPFPIPLLPPVIKTVFPSSNFIRFI